MTIGKFSFSKWELFLFLFFLLFSSVLMFKTFGLTSEGNLSIASKAWSDFAATIPLIRSFSKGSNFPPEYPIFAGQPIRYHFAFYFIVGTLEKIGFPLNLALNLPSILGFTLLLCIIYFFAKKVFKNKAVGLISTVFFLFNGSFSFLEFFKKNPLSVNTFTQIVNNQTFSSFGPYDGKIVSAFWNLNIFTNQRHLAFAYAIFLLIFLIIDKYSGDPEKFTYKKALLLGLVVGIFPFIHYAVFGMLGILLLVCVLIYSKIRLQLIFAGLTSLFVAIPQILYMGKSNLTFDIVKIGYLTNNPTFNSLTNYWLLNIGITLILSSIGFLFSNKRQKRIFIPFVTLFIFGNLFQLSAEIAANHKFFNLYLVGANMFTAFFLVKIWQSKILGRLFVITIFPFLILSGVIDFFPIFNDNYITLADIPNNKTASFIENKTPKNSVFLNGSFLYDPASLAGRKIYLGWPYFSWSAGYDTDNRFRIMKKILESSNKSEICTLLRRERIDFVEIQYTTQIEEVRINYLFYEDNFNEIFNDAETKIKLYDVNTSCKSYI